MVAMANRTSFRYFLVFPIICIAQNEGLKISYLQKYLVDCDEL